MPLLAGGIICHSDHSWCLSFFHCSLLSSSNLAQCSPLPRSKLQGLGYVILLPCSQSNIFQYPIKAQLPLPFLAPNPVPNQTLRGLKPIISCLFELGLLVPINSLHDFHSPCLENGWHIQIGAGLPCYEANSSSYQSCDAQPISLLSSTPCLLPIRFEGCFLPYSLICLLKASLCLYLERL